MEKSYILIYITVDSSLTPQICTEVWGGSIERKKKRKYCREVWENAKRKENLEGDRSNQRKGSGSGMGGNEGERSQKFLLHVWPCINVPKSKFD